MIQMRREWGLYTGEEESLARFSDEHEEDPPSETSEDLGDMKLR